MAKWEKSSNVSFTNAVGNMSEKLLFKYDKTPRQFYI